MAEIGICAPGQQPTHGTRGSEVERNAAWFAVFTIPRHEKRVAEYFAHVDLECFLPLYSETRQWRNRLKVEVHLPLFPCYLFARMDRRERPRAMAVPGVVEILGCSGEFLPVPDETIDFLKCGVRQKNIEPHPNVTTGDKVRITDGPMAGNIGLLTNMKNGLRVVVRLESIARSVAVEVGADQVERIC